MLESEHHGSTGSVWESARQVVTGQRPCRWVVPPDTPFATIPGRCHSQLPLKWHHLS